MEHLLDKILNRWVFLSINIAIVFITELSGVFFIEKGIIHLIALFFVLLGVSRIFLHYDVYDRYLRLLIHGGSIALLIFSASHLIEFLGYVYFKIYEDAIFVSVINLYIASILAITIGAEYFLRALKKHTIAKIGVLSVSTVVFLILSVLILLEKISVSLEPDGPVPYIYSALVLGVSLLGISHLIAIKKNVPLMKGFVNYFIGALILISISALQYAFYEILESIGISNIQIIYISHFLFYGALSLMFLAFANLVDLGGVYRGIEKYKKMSKTQESLKDKI